MGCGADASFVAKLDDMETPGHTLAAEPHPRGRTTVQYPLRTNGLRGRMSSWVDDGRLSLSTAAGLFSLSEASTSISPSPSTCTSPP